MAYEFNPEAMPKVATGISGLEEYISSGDKRIEVFEEIARQSGAKKFIDQVEALKEASSSLCEVFRDFTGVDGDKFGEGSLHGCLKTMKTLDAQMNGE